MKNVIIFSFASVFIFASCSDAKSEDVNRNIADQNNEIAVRQFFLLHKEIQEDMGDRKVIMILEKESDGNIHATYKVNKNKTNENVEGQNLITPIKVSSIVSLKPGEKRQF